jgi:hypothetical protein
MANPIRWDNIRGPSLAEASRPLDAATATFNGAFDRLGGVLAQREAIDAANWQNTKTNNTNAFLDTVAKYRTPEELQAAQASGALDQLRAGFGNQIDAGAVRGAADARVLQTMQMKQQQIGYEHAMADERSTPFMQAYKVAALKGDKNAMSQAEMAYQQAGGRDLSGLVGYADARDQEVKLRGQQDKRFGLDMRTGEETILNAQDGRRHNRVMEGQGQQRIGLDQQRIGLEGQRLSIDKENAAWNREDRNLLRISNAAKIDKDARNAAYEAVIKNSPLDRGVITTTAGKEELFKGLKSMGIEKSAAEDLIYNLGKRFPKGQAMVGVDDKKNPVMTDIPVSVILDAIGSSSENVLSALTPGWSRRGDEAVDTIAKRMGTDKDLQRAIAAVEEAQMGRRNPNLISEFRQTMTASTGTKTPQKVSNTFETPPVKPKAGDTFGAKNGKDKMVWVDKRGWMTQEEIEKDRKK